MLAGRIEHIGSTAIPGMDAKDVLDLQVSVADLDAATRAFDEPLGALGFERGAYAHAIIWTHAGQVNQALLDFIPLTGTP